MSSNILDKTKNTFCEIKPNIQIWALISLIHSVWTQYFILQVFAANSSLFNDIFFLPAILNTCNVSYIVTNFAIIWENNKERKNWFKLWGFVKIFDTVCNVVSLITCLIDLRYYNYWTLIDVVLLALGMYIMCNVKNIFDQLPTEDDKNNEKNLTSL